VFAWIETLCRQIEEMLDDRFLRRHGCDDWKQFYHRYDPNVNCRATRIRDFYHGYSVFYCIEDHQHPAYYWDVYQSGISKLQDWADSNCQGQVRFDFHRATKESHANDEWEVNELSGVDHIFAAFENASDATMFALRWT